MQIVEPPEDVLELLEDMSVYLRNGIYVSRIEVLSFGELWEDLARKLPFVGAFVEFQREWGLPSERFGIPYFITSTFDVVLLSPITQWYLAPALRDAIGTRKIKVEFMNSPMKYVSASPLWKHPSMVKWLVWARWTNIRLNRKKAKRRNSNERNGGDGYGVGGEWQL